MMLANIALVLASVAGEPKVTLEAPTVYVQGEAFPVKLIIEAPADGAKLEGWQLTPAAFTVAGVELAKRQDAPAVELKAGEKKTVELDLAPVLVALRDFELVWGTLPPRPVRSLEPAPKGLNFQDEKGVATADLGKYWALLRTNRGDVVVEFWPDVAPGHVRNFLDLAYTGFYDGLGFHRVIPGFMIQGGDPTGSGSGNGPRNLVAEFNAKKHLRGVLSMARSNDPNSGSCQFFIMHATAPHLDGKYSGFGQVVTGMEAVDLIVNTPRDARDKPKEPQVMQNVVVVKAPEDRAAWTEAKAQK